MTQVIRKLVSFVLVTALIVCTVKVVECQTVKRDKRAPVTKIAFGSCADQDRPQPIWEAVNKWNPDVFIFAGDNIYGDTENMDTLRAEYEKLSEKEGFQKLRASTRIFSIWDDHDYGANDTGHWYPRKEASEEIFLDFWGVPEESPRRSRPGIYGAHRLGPPGKRIQFILLDTRYFRSKFSKKSLTKVQKELGYGPYAPNMDSAAQMLGESQWEWLARQLRKPAQIRFIVSSVQVISAEHGWESWAMLPKEKQRLYNMIDSMRVKGVIFLSGDVHWSEISRYDGLDYPLYDFTSSGLNQEFTEVLNLPNHQRMKSMVYPYPNFGAIKIDWNKKDPVIDMSAKNLNGKVVFNHQVSLTDLQ